MQTQTLLTVCVIGCLLMASIDGKYGLLRYHM